MLSIFTVSNKCKEKLHIIVHIIDKSSCLINKENSTAHHSFTKVDIFEQEEYFNNSTFYLTLNLN